MRRWETRSSIHWQQRQLTFSLIASQRLAVFFFRPSSVLSRSELQKKLPYLPECEPSNSYGRERESVLGLSDDSEMNERTFIKKSVLNSKLVGNCFVICHTQSRNWRKMGETWLLPGSKWPCRSPKRWPNRSQSFSINTVDIWEVEELEHVISVMDTYRRVTAYLESLWLFWSMGQASLEPDKLIESFYPSHRSSEREQICQKTPARLRVYQQSRSTRCVLIEPISH